MDNETRGIMNLAQLAAVFEVMFPRSFKIEALSRASLIRFCPKANRRNSLQHKTKLLTLKRFQSPGTLSRSQLHQCRFHAAICRAGNKQFKRLYAFFGERRALVNLINDGFFRVFRKEIRDLDIQHLKNVHQTIHRDRGLIPLKLRNETLGKISAICQLFLS